MTGVYRSKERTTLNSVVIIAQNISAAWCVKKLRYLAFVSFYQSSYQEGIRTALLSS